jgi:hypothetical protein
VPIPLALVPWALAFVAWPLGWLPFSVSDALFIVMIVPNPVRITSEILEPIDVCAMTRDIADPGRDSRRRTPSCTARSRATSRRCSTRARRNQRSGPRPPASSVVTDPAGANNDLHTHWRHHMAPDFGR